MKSEKICVAIAERKMRGNELDKTVSVLIKWKILTPRFKVLLSLRDG